MPLASIQPEQPGPSPQHWTPELVKEFEGYTLALLRRRFLWFSGALGSVAAFFLLLVIILKLADISMYSLLIPAFRNKSDTILPFLLSVLVQALLVGWYAGCFWTVRRKAMTGQELIRLSYLLVAVHGMLAVVLARLPGTQASGLLVAGIVHFLACCFLPWSPRQAIMPLIPVIAVWTTLEVTIGTGSIGGRLLTVPWGLLIGVPGVALCALRHTQRLERYERTFFYKRYREVKRELVDARRIHESLFPTQVIDGSVRVHYKYEPMQQIGGDFLYVHRPEQNPDQLSVVLLDVTGHGVLAALTVNRIWGELRRIFAEHPNIAPGNVLHLLNRYAHLTLAPYGVYLTAKIVRIDATNDMLEYASGGHPPAYLYREDGSIVELESTAFVLGACPDADYVPDPKQMAMNPGDVLLLYTDGMNEARGLSGRLLGLDGLRKIINEVGATHPRQGEWPDKIFSRMEAFRAGAPADDTILVEVSRPSAIVSPRSPRDRKRQPVPV